ncbi:MAG TPA: hypothetical protein VNL77_14780, partial [Roseiflexaceae bacterium]|nr:hypothetical protein [Roseiflexaceae bacterium]
MSRFAHAWRLPTALALLITLALATGGTLTLPRPPAARAQISATSGQPMASLVDCIRPGRELPGGSFESSPRFATTCFASLWDYQDYNDPRNTGTTPGNAPRTDKAVVAFGDAKVPHPTLPNTSIDDPSEYKGDGVATVGDVGAVYGLAFSSGEHPAASNGG